MILPCATGLELPQQRVLPYGWRVKRVVLRGPARLQLPEGALDRLANRLKQPPTKGPKNKTTLYKCKPRMYFVDT